MKKVSMILALAMICSLFRTGITANAAANAVSVADDFESYETSYALPASSTQALYLNQWGLDQDYMSAAIAEDAAHGKFVKATNTSTDKGGNLQYRTTAPIAEKTDDAHIVKYEMDIKPGNGTIVYLPIGNYHDKEIGNVYGVMFSGGKVYIGEWGNGSNMPGAGTYTEGKWYHITALYDLELCKLQTYITQLPETTEADGATSYTINRKIISAETDIPSTSGAYGKSGAYGITYYIAPKTIKTEGEVTTEIDNGIEVDNVKVSRTDRWERILIDENFDSVQENFEYYSYSHAKDGWVTPNNQKATVVKDAQKGKVLSIPTADKNTVKYIVGDARAVKPNDTKHIIRYEVDVKTDAFAAIQPMMYESTYTGSKTRCFYGINFYNGNLYTGGWEINRFGTFTVGKWYNAVMEYDVATGLTYVKVTDANGNSQQNFIKQTVLDINTYPYGAGIQLNGNNVFVDNVKVSAVDEFEFEQKPSVLMDDNFESYETGASLSAGTSGNEAWGVPKGTTLTVADLNDSVHGKVLKFTTGEVGCDAKFGFGDVMSNLALGTSKKVKYELDICPSEAGTNVYLAAGTAYNSYQSLYAAQFISRRLYLGAWGNGSNMPAAGVYEPGRWYHIEAIVDFNNYTFDTKVTSDKGVEYELTDIAFDKARTGCRGIDIFAAANSTVYADNIKISNAYSDDFVNKTEMRYADDFDDYNSAAEFNPTSPNNNLLNADNVKVHGWKISGTTKGKNSEGKDVDINLTNEIVGASSFKDRDGDGKYFELGIPYTDGKTVNTSMAHGLNTTVSGGKFTYRYDIKPSEGIGTATIRITGENADDRRNEQGTYWTTLCPIAFTQGTADGQTVYQIMTMNESPISDSNSASYERFCLGDYTPGIWYHCEVTIDVANGTYSCTVTGDDDTMCEVTDREIPGERPETNYKEIALMGWASGGASIGFDNFEIAYDTAVPVLTGASYEAGGSSFEEPVAGADKIILKFNTALSSTSFRKGTVTLSGDDGNEIAFDGSVSGDKYIMTLTNGTIRTGVNYTINVSDKVLSANLDKMAAADSISFTGAKGVSAYKLKSVDVDGPSWEEVIQNGLEFPLSAVVAVNNADAEDYTMILIDARYDAEGKLVSVKSYPITAAVGESEDKTITLDDTQPDIAEYKFMLWDGFDSLTPISASIAH